VAKEMSNKDKKMNISFNPWHNVPIGKNFPDVVQAVIEIPKGSNAKYELDKETGMLRLDRVLFSTVYYPANYGFIPQTYGKDNDPLDILVLSEIDVQPLCIVEAKVIGVMRMIDNKQADDKIIAVAEKDMSINYINAITELPPHFILQLRNFFESYKKLENKTVKVEEFQNASIAKKIIQQAMKDYKVTFKI
jgi:inorganic pyrophosphatase